MSEPRPTPSADAARHRARASTCPRYRPDDRFWPYVDLPEQPDEDELLAIEPDLRAALYGPAGAPFSITIAFPRFDGPDYARAVELAKASAEYRETGDGEGFRHRARFLPNKPLDLRDLFEVVGRLRRDRGADRRPPGAVRARTVAAAAAGS